MSAPMDREQLRRDLSDALSAQRDHDVTGLAALAASLTALDPPYPFQGRQIQSALAPTPRQYSALIRNLVQVLAKLERDVV